MAEPTQSGSTGRPVSSTGGLPASQGTQLVSQSQDTQKTPQAAPSASRGSVPLGASQGTNRSAGLMSDAMPRSGMASFGAGSSFGAARTPVTVRGDIGRAIHRRSGSFAALMAESDGTPDALGAGAPPSETTGTAGEVAPTLIWGTRMDVRNIERKFYRFLTQYSLEDAPDALTGDVRRLSKYMRVIGEVVDRNDGAVSIDCSEMHTFDPALYTFTVNYPREVIPLMDPIVRELAIQIMTDRGLHDENEPDETMGQNIQVRLFNLREPKAIRDLNPADMDHLISVSGMVTRTSAVIPDMTQALFTCEKCNCSMRAPNVSGSIHEPTRCPSCENKFTFRLVHNESEFLNKQLIKMQEAPDAIPEGETPHAVTLFAYDDLVDYAKPGDRVTVTAIFRAAPMRANPRMRAVKSVYRTYLDVIHVRRDEKAALFSVRAAAGETATDEATPNDTETPKPDDAEVRFGDAAGAPTGGDGSEDKPSSGAAHMEGPEGMLPGKLAERAEALRAIADKPNVYELLTKSFAPSIFGMDDVKKGILCQLFGATRKAWAGGKVRGEINILLVGDPGVSKSQLLSYAHALAPRGIYTSGRGSSAVGLTAYVAKDPETREMVLESGALVLSDRGVCCIDEFDKMSDGARSMLHEVMEQATVSVAKAGIISTLNARTSVLAAANPIKSKYDKALSITENINLPPSLVSRFDLIYVLLDKAEEHSDMRLAQHLVALYRPHPPESALGEDFIPLELMKDYIAYARSQVFPRLSEGAGQLLVQEYLEMRQAGRGRNVISATPRQLESLIRLAEALARMRLSEHVTEGDVREASRLMKDSLRQSLYDDRLGVIDQGMLTEGGGASARAEEEHIAREVLKLVEDSRGEKLSAWKLKARLREQADESVKEKLTDELVKKVLTALNASGQLRFKDGVAQALNA